MRTSRTARKKSLPSRVVARLRRGSIVFSLGWPPISYTYPLAGKEKAPLSKRKRRVPSLTPIQREALPMIHGKIQEAKGMGRNDLVLLWSAIEYAVKSPRKAERTLNEILEAL